MGKVLEVAIGLIFAFTLVSMAASVINEWLSALLAQRATFLFQGIKALLGDAVGSDVWNHPVIRGLAPLSKPANPPKPRHPSYVPAATFVQSLLAVVVKPAAPAAGAPAPAPLTVGDVLAAVNDIQDPQTKQALLALIQDAEGKIEVLKAKIAGWFDAAMERVSGQYKRWSQRWLFVFGLVVAVATGVDAIHLARVLWADDALRLQVVREAEAAAQAEQTASDAAASAPTTASAQGAEPAGEASVAPAAREATAMADATAVPAATPVAELATPIPPATTALAAEASPVSTPPPSMEEVKKRRQQAFESVGRIGRTSLPLVPLTMAPQMGVAYAWHLPGFLITALAACLGAPFWFDVLNKVINLRLAGAVTPAKGKRGN